MYTIAKTYICNSLQISFQRQFQFKDLFKTANINQDQYTATFNTDFYLDYLINFSEQCFVEEDYQRDSIKGYMIGKDEGRTEQEYHIHVSAVTVAPEYRKSQVGTRLMNKLEQVGNIYQCKFCDLFVREDNKNANLMYERLQYEVFRTVVKYYVDKDAYDRRKCLDADKDQQSLKNKGKSIKKWIDYQF